MVSIESLGYVEASTAIAAGMQAAQRFGRPMAFAVMDQAGDLIASARMDDVPARVLRQATRKAYTAAVMATDTGSNGQKLKEQGRSISEMGDLQLTGMQGGLVIKRDGVILGGIGVGGYNGGHLDEALAKIGLEVLMR